VGIIQYRARPEGINTNVREIIIRILSRKGQKTEISTAPRPGTRDLRGEKGPGPERRDAMDKPSIFS
jgi:hypothetical protein